MKLGAFALTGTGSDVYRIEVETVSNAISGAAELEFGRQDALDQVANISAVRRSIQIGLPARL